MSQVCEFFREYCTIGDEKQCTLFEIFRAGVRKGKAHKKFEYERVNEQYNLYVKAKTQILLTLLTEKGKQDRMKEKGNLMLEHHTTDQTLLIQL